MQVEILGKTYTIERRKPIDDPQLINADGYCDYSVTLIVLDCETREDDPDAIADASVWERKILRHEIIHAFLFESGLHEYSHDEVLVDWIAAQLPKITKCMQGVGAL